MTTEMSGRNPSPSQAWRTLAPFTAAILLYGCGPAGKVIDSGHGEARPSVAVLDVQRGVLLYNTQCIACHSTQMHWRDNSIVGSGSDLLVQVERWQHNAKQH